MALIIRQATVEDAEIVLGIVAAAFAEYEGALAVRPSALEDTLESTQRDIAEGRTLLASILPPGEDALSGDTQPAGTARYEVEPDCLYVGRVAVLPNWRMHGVGRAIMQEIERIAPALGLARIRLATRESMTSNLAFYEQLGYRVEKREQHPRGPDVIVWFEKTLQGVDTHLSQQRHPGPRGAGEVPEL